MKRTCLYILSTVFLLTVFATNAFAADPHLEFSPTSGTIETSGTEIDVLIDTGGQEAKSAKAVINFDSSKLEVTSIEEGSFFDDVSHNIYSSQVIINANLSLGSSLESKTGTGTLATMIVEAKSTSGTAALTFDCTAGDSTDSGINDPTPTDIIVCSANVDGSYTLGEGTVTASPNPSPSDDAGVGGGTDEDATPSALPESGTIEYTFAFLTLGVLLLILGIPAYIFK